MQWPIVPPVFAFFVVPVSYRHESSAATEIIFFVAVEYRRHNTHDRIHIGILYAIEEEP